jgi:hypothetical protein
MRQEKGFLGSFGEVTSSSYVSRILTALAKVDNLVVRIA